MKDRYVEPELSRSVLITIDTQCDTLDGQSLEIPGTSQVLPNMKLLLDEYRKYEFPIVHVVRIYKKDGSNADLCRRSAVKSGSSSLEIIQVFMSFLSRKLDGKTDNFVEAVVDKCLVVW